jgi:hypothetical protein
MQEKSGYFVYRTTAVRTVINVNMHVTRRERGLGYKHCNENPIYVLPEKELRGLGPNFYIHVSVSSLYIQRIGPHIFLQQIGQTDCVNI